MILISVLTWPELNDIMVMVSLRLKQMVTDGLSLDVTVNLARFPERRYVYGDSSSKGAKYYVTGDTGCGTGDSSCYGYCSVCVKAC